MSHDVFGDMGVIVRERGGSFSLTSAREGDAPRTFTVTYTPAWRSGGQPLACTRSTPVEAAEACVACVEGQP